MRPLARRVPRTVPACWPTPDEGAPPPQAARPAPAPPRRRSRRLARRSIIGGSCSEACRGSAGPLPAEPRETADPRSTGGGPAFSRGLYPAWASRGRRVVREWQSQRHAEGWRGMAEAQVFGRDAEGRSISSGGSCWPAAAGLAAAALLPAAGTAADARAASRAAGRPPTRRRAVDVHHRLQQLLRVRDDQGRSRRRTPAG